MHGNDRAACLAHTRQQQARPSHVDALPDPQFQFAVARAVEIGEQRRGGRGRAAGGGIFGQTACARMEHPRLQIAGLFAGRHVARIEIDRIRTVARKCAGERRGIRALPAAAPRARQAPPSGTAIRRRRSAADAGRFSRRPPTARDSRPPAPRSICVSRFSGCGAVSSAPTTRPCSIRISTGTSPAFSSNFSRAGGFAACVASTKAVPTLGWPANGISERTVKMRTCASLPHQLRRQHKGGLGIIELGGDGLHLRGRQPSGIQHDGQRIAAEGAVGKNVDGDIAPLHVEYSHPYPNCHTGTGRS